MTTNLKDKQKDLQQLIAKKIQELQNLENMRNQLTQEIVKLQGRDEMLKELIAEEDKASQSVLESSNEK